MEHEAEHSAIFEYVIKFQVLIRSWEAPCGSLFTPLVLLGEGI
jgi:hypothetical protein